MKRSISLFILPALIALLAALFLAAPAFAQDEVPPEVPVETMSEIPVEGAGTEIPADPAVVEEVPEEAPPAEELAPVLEEAAETGVILVDGSGEPLALAEAGTAEILSGGDPYYKVGTGTYMFVLSPDTCPDPLPAGVVHCEASATPIQAAIDYIPTSGLPTDGMIYIEASNYTENITVDAAATDILKGLKGLIGEVVDYDPRVKLAGSILINEIDLGFKIKGFNLNNGNLRILNSLGTITVEDSMISNPGSDLGIQINAGGPVILNRVKVDDNAEGGALIISTKNVTITNSSFDRNDPDYGEMVGGLKIIANGAVLLDGVSASHNPGLSGLSISRASSVIIKNSIFSDNTNAYGAVYGYVDGAPSPNITLTNVYLNDNRQGLQLSAKGNISLTGVHADGNSYFGANLDTCYQSGGACNWAGTGVITIKDSTFDDNGFGEGYYGLLVVSRGAITLTNVSASGNTHATGMPAGALLYADYSLLMNKVTVTNSQFNGNINSGLNISTKGPVLLTKVKANQNSVGYGLKVDNCIWDGGKCLGTGTVTITGSAPADNQFNENYLNGINIKSKGAISLKYVEVGLTQHSDAAYLINYYTGATSGVTVTNSTFGIYDYDNYGRGLWIATNGSVTLSSITASWNLGGPGILVSSAGANASVTIKDAVVDHNQGDGLSIIAMGTITLSNVHAIDSLLSGARLINNIGKGAVNITNSEFSYNYGLDPQAGLIVQTNGLVTLNKVSAIDNWGYGVSVDNTGGIAGVSVISSTFSFNDLTGIIVLTNGAITVNSIVASGGRFSGAKGAVLDNDSALAANVTITNGTFHDNYTTGLEILSRGNITLTNVFSDDNDSIGSNGATLDNSSGTGFIKITNLASTDTVLRPGFDDNYNMGLEIFTNGVVTLTNVNMVENGAEGLRVWQELNKGVTLTNCHVTTNNLVSGTAAILIETIGPVVIKGGYAANNFAIGLWVNNSLALNTLPKPVTISSFTTNNNLGGGIHVLSKGVITLTNVTAQWNNVVSAGIYLDNELLTAGITLSNVISEHNVIGMDIRTNGQLTYKSGNVADNTGNGIQLNSPETALAKTVALSNLRIEQNGGYGMIIKNKGAVTLTNVSVVDNDGHGLQINNQDCTPATPCPVSLLTTGSGINEFSVNGTFGLEISTYGTVILNKVNAKWNQGMGVTVNNRMATIPANITVTGGHINVNRGIGLYLWSRGAISMTGIEVNDNGTIFSDYGAILRNSDDITGTKGVTVTRSTFDRNTALGLYIHSRGAVVLNTIQANENTMDYGVFVDNRDAGLKKPVTILASYGTNNFNANNQTNLVINSTGIVSLTRVNADSSVNGKGIEINSYGVGNPVIFNTVSTRYNAQDGITIETNANVTLKNVTSLFNGQGTGTFAGIYITTNGSPTAKVTFTTGLVSGNNDYGIRMDLGGPGLYTLTGVYFFGNNYDGLGDEANLLVE